jgi:hypothetical protein
MLRPKVSRNLTKNPHSGEHTLLGGWEEGQLRWDGVVVKAKAERTVEVESIVYGLSAKAGSSVG